ncbi:MAG: helix-turn-helix domain-containing protein [Bacillota bacterium]|nr:helix-turn-helix domain-containing protein [Bacillota bacterium]
MRRDLTQADLAAKVRVRRETLLYLEKGIYNPSVLLAARVAHALGSAVDGLFTIDDLPRRVRC